MGYSVQVRVTRLDRHYETSHISSYSEDGCDGRVNSYLLKIIHHYLDYWFAHNFILNYNNKGTSLIFT